MAGPSGNPRESRCRFGFMIFSIRTVPYGVYDLMHNEGWVNVGITHDTAELAVESIRRWWEQMGQSVYPDPTELLITGNYRIDPRG